MFKFLLIVFAVPIICRIIDERQYDRNMIKERIERSSYDNDEDYERETCNETEGYIFVERDLSHKNCLNEVDYEKFKQEVETMKRDSYSAYLSNSTRSEQQNSATINAIQMYCPNAKNIYMCYSYSPIVGCKHVERIKFSKILSEMYQRGLNFLCENKAQRAIEFINEKIIDCRMLKAAEIDMCAITEKPIGSLGPSQLTVNEMCILMEDSLNCFIKTIEQCHLSQTLGTLMKSLYAYVRPAACAETGNMTTLSTPTELHHVSKNIFL